MTEFRWDVDGAQGYEPNYEPVLVRRADGQCDLVEVDASGSISEQVGDHVAILSGNFTVGQAVDFAGQFYPVC